MLPKNYKTNRQFIYRWKNRYDGSWDSLRDRSRRPHSHPNHHTLAEIKLIQDMRRRNPHAGLVGRILGQAHAAGLSTLDPRTLLVPYETRNDCSKASQILSTFPNLMNRCPIPDRESRLT